jgi:protein SCO1
MTRKNLVLAVLGALIGLTMVMIYLTSLPYNMHGSVIDPPQPAPAIALSAGNGQAFDLSQQRGRVVLLFFGYTSCPDVCPATLSQLRQVFSGLGQQSDSVRVVFVTVDPKRDTPDVLQRYLSAFGAGYIGLSGSQEQLEAVWKSYGIFRAERPFGDNSDNYTVDHTARLYVIDAQGRLRMTYPYGTSTDDILLDLKHILKEG